MKKTPIKYLASESLHGGQFTLSTQLIKPDYLVILPPTQHHSFFRNLPPLSNTYFSQSGSSGVVELDYCKCWNHYHRCNCKQPSKEFGPARIWYVVVRYTGPLNQARQDDYLKGGKDNCNCFRSYDHMNCVRNKPTLVTCRI